MLRLYVSLCLFNFYAEYIMRNARLGESQAGIKTAERNNNNLRYANDTTLMVESKEELKSFLMKVKEGSENVALKVNIQRSKMMANRWGKGRNSGTFYFLGLQNHCGQ